MKSRNFELCSLEYNAIRVIKWLFDLFTIEAARSRNAVLGGLSNYFGARGPST